ncbi:MAG TPA: hypothetical protein V6C81_13510 [Planktothrix sp.]
MNRQKIRIDLPKWAMAEYYVPIKKPPADAKSLIAESVKRHVGGTVREITLKMLPIMRVDVDDKNDYPMPAHELLKVMGASAKQLSIIDKTKQIAAIEAPNKPVWPPYHEFAARAAAGALAFDQNSVVIDKTVPIVMSAEDALSKLPRGDEAPLFTDWIMVISSQSDDGIWMTTKGMSRVGLPELQAIGVPPQLLRSFTSVMVGLAYNIMKQYAGTVTINSVPDHFDLPADIRISESDIAEAYRHESEHGGETSVHLKLDKKKGEPGNAFLTITVPATDRRTRGEYMIDINDKLFGPHADGVIPASLSPEMLAAMHTARSKLSEIRTRFVAHKLPKESQLIVKFPVHSGEHTEYLWAFVNGWDSPDKLNCHCGNDANLDPKLRAGTPLTLKPSDLVDWAVVQNDNIIEGGWTNKLLGQ